MGVNLATFLDSSWLWYASQFHSSNLVFIIALLLYHQLCETRRLHSKQWYMLLQKSDLWSTNADNVKRLLK